MQKGILTGVALLAVGAAMVPGCFFGDMNDCDYNLGLQCFWNNQGGTGGAGGTGGSSPECIPSDANRDIANSCGAFVSPAGSDTSGDGTRENPYRTLGKAAAEKARVYACADTDKPFDEAVAPEADVAIYGGFDCASDWRYDPGKRSVWTAPADSVPLIASGDVKVEVHDFLITARDAAAAGGSSVAVLATGDKTELTLERCGVVAGNAKEGATPEKPEGAGAPGDAGKDGAAGCVDATSKLGGDAGTNLCAGTSYEGGPGGNGTTASGGQGSDGTPSGATGRGGQPQTTGGQTCTAGEFGANGTEGDPGIGATGHGTLSATGYLGTTGGDGVANGAPGQGGGGGGGAKVCAKMGFAGPGGGGGGAGGCPGAQPGKGGGPGGASLGVASVGASLTLTNVTITSKKGGAGGTGGEGQSGGKGGDGGNAGEDGGDAEASACDGGKGGKGGDGGPGGGGQGGHSVALAFTGPAPKQTKVVLNPGVAGPGGVAGAKNAAAASVGAPGQACRTFDFQDGTCTK